MAVQTLRAMFEYQLAEMYGVEHDLVDVLGELADETTNDGLREAFETHREETRRHVERLESVFAALDRDPERRASAALDGLVTDHDEFTEAATQAELVDIFDIGAALKAERFEMTAYESLLMLAEELDLGDDVTDPLQQNLDEEEKTRTELKTLAGGSRIEAVIRNLL